MDLAEHVESVKRLTMQPGDKLAVVLNGSVLADDDDLSELSRLRETTARWAGIDVEDVLIVAGPVEDMHVLSPTEEDTR